MSSSKSYCSIVSLAEGKDPFSPPSIDGSFYVENSLREEQNEVTKQKKSAKATPQMPLWICTPNGGANDESQVQRKRLPHHIFSSAATNEDRN
jgi:hypothetical protein